MSKAAAVGAGAIADTSSAGTATILGSGKHGDGGHTEMVIWCHEGPKVAPEMDTDLAGL